MEKIKASYVLKDPNPPQAVEQALLRLLLEKLADQGQP